MFRSQELREFRCPLSAIEANNSSTTIYSCAGSCSAVASPMKIELNIVNTIAWMKHTSTSSVDIKTLMRILTALIPRNTPVDLAATRKIIHTSEMAIA